MVLLILGMLKKKGIKLANVTDQKRPNHKGFSLLLFKLALYLFNHLRIDLFVH